MGLHGWRIIGRLLGCAARKKMEGNMHRSQGSWKTAICLMSAGSVRRGRARGADAKDWSEDAVRML